MSGSGALLGGRYRLLARLGAGAQAEAHLAHDELRSEKVVLKAVHPGSEAAAAREFRLRAGLRHPNLVEALDLLRVEGRPWLVEQHAAGPDLASWAASDRRPERVVLAVAAALRGLRFLHAQGIVHRDLKPDSIRIEDRSLGGLPAARLVDFGVAARDPAGEVVGTLGYAAPEALAGEPATPASDLYSLGALLLEALTGRRLDTLPPGPLPLPPGLVAELLQALLTVDPAQRPGSDRMLEVLSTVAGRSLELSRADLLAEYFPEPPLLGREHPLGVLERAVDDVRGGARRAIRLLGPGRTTLARHACALARLAGLEVRTPASPRDLLHGFSSAKGQLPPDRLATHIVDHLLEQRGEAGLLVWLDDWPVQDAVAGAVLHELARGGGPRLLLICSGDVPSELRLEELQLQPLHRADVERLIASMLQHPDPGWIDQVHTLSGGDPRLVVALVRGQIELGVDEFSLQKGATLAKLAPLAGRRLEQLSSAEVHLLALLSLSPEPVSLAVLSQLSRDGAALVPRLLQRGLLTTSPEGALLPAGTALAEACLERLPAAERPALHQAFAAVLDPANDPGTLAHHLLRAGQIERAASLLVEARLPLEEDLQLALERLQQQLGSQHPLDEPLRERLARQLRGRGDLQGALALASKMAPSPRSLLVAELLVDAGRAAEAARELTDQAHQAEGVPETFSARRSLLLARAHFLLGDHQRALTEARAGLEQEGLTDEERVQLGNLVGLALIYQGEVSSGLEGLSRLRAELPAAGPESLARLHNSLGIALQRLGRWEEAAQAYEVCFELGRKVGDLRLAASSALNLATLALRRLDLSRCQELGERALSLARRGGVSTTTAAAAANLGNLLMLLGARAEARPLLEEAQALADPLRVGPLAGQTRVYLAELLLEEGNSAGAARLLEETHSADAATVLMRDLVAGEVELRAGRTSEAAARARSVLERLTADDPERWRAHWLHGRALRGLGETESALFELELSAVLAHRQHGERPWAVHAALAALEHQLGQPSDAAYHAAQSRALLEELRQRVPSRYRASFEQRDEVREGLLDLESIPHRAPDAAGEPSAAELLRLLEINRQLSQLLPVDQLLERILDAAIELTGAERGFVLLGSAERLRVAASRNIDREAVRRGVRKFSRTIARLALVEDRPVVAADAMEDERFGAGLSIHGLKLRAVLCVPLHAGPTAGALYLDNRFRPGAFHAGHVRLVQAFADQAGIALEAARLLQETAEQREALATARAELLAQSSRLQAQVVRQAEELSEISARLRHQEEELIRRYAAANLVGRSKPMRELFVQIDRVTEADLPVFIWGESGTGKELVARAIHYASSRREQPFITINCGAIPSSLLESELFGHAKGAFTGALRDRPGLFEVATRGTLFLDEVGDMPAEMQVKLLRVLQEGTFRRLGEERERHSDCRILSASLHQLEQLVREGRFREDLFYRLNVVQIAVPALRDRRQDIPLLVEHILSSLPRRVTVAPGALAALVDFEWPGNVRQLENELQRAALLGEDRIELAALSPALRRTGVDGPSRGQGLAPALEDCERRLIEAALERHGYRITEAAAELGIHRVVLHRKMRRFGIARPASAERAKESARVRK